jgi:hypothetical protein
MGKTINLPAPIDADGKPLSAEQIEEFALEPVYVPVSIERDGKTAVFHVAADFDQVSTDADQTYQLSKASAYRIYADGPKRKVRNSKLTNLKEDEDGEEEGTALSGDQNEKLVALRPKQRQAHLGLLFPSGWEVNPVIVGTNIPGLPEGPDFKTWMEKGGSTADLIIEALVMAYDPTGPLAQGKEQQRQAAEMAKEMSEAFKEGISKIRQGPVLEESEPSSPNDLPSSLHLVPTSEAATASSPTTSVSTGEPGPAATAAELAAVNGAKTTAKPSSGG